jgi:hypothetical protein
MAELARRLQHAGGEALEVAGQRRHQRRVVRRHEQPDEAANRHADGDEREEVELVGPQADVGRSPDRG